MLTNFYVLGNVLFIEKKINLIKIKNFVMPQLEVKEIKIN